MIYIMSKEDDKKPGSPAYAREQKAIKALLKEVDNEAETLENGRVDSDSKTV